MADGACFLFLFYFVTTMFKRWLVSKSCASLLSAPLDPDIHRERERESDRDSLAHIAIAFKFEHSFSTVQSVQRYLLL